MSALTWTKSAHHDGTLEAYSDQLLVGWVMVRVDGSIWFDATLAVHMKWITKQSSGVVSSMDKGKAAVERAWSDWLTFAHLNKTDSPSRSDSPAG